MTMTTQRKAFKVSETTTESLKASIQSAVKYDLIGKLAEQTQLTRNTIAEILQGINVAVFSQYKKNPEDFTLKATRLINEQKATVIVEHLAYDPLDETHSSDIFTRDKPKEDFSKAFKTERHIYDYVFTDSKNERTFVQELDSSTEVVVYANLPKTFTIPTPVGNYTPDWAIAFQEGSPVGTLSVTMRAFFREVELTQPVTEEWFGGFRVPFGAGRKF